MDIKISEIKEYVIEKNLIDADEISEETDIENDLGLTGNDAEEFIADFSEKFKVDISEFDFKSYFLAEGIDFSSFFNFFSPKKRKKLRLLDLHEAVKKGKLI